MTDEDINWFEGKYPSWQDGIERNAKAAIEEIHQMAVEAMPKTPYANTGQERLRYSYYDNLGMQGQSYSRNYIPHFGLF